MSDVLEIFCDESGHTGPNLLDPDQRTFTFGSVAISDVEAFELISTGRQKYGILDAELKAKDLSKTDSGRAFIFDVLYALEGRYLIVVYDKLLALCAKVFEYIYEPVYQDDPYLLYKKNLHKFVAMYCYVFFTSQDEQGGEAVRQFQRFMRSYDPAAAPLLFGDDVRLSPETLGNPFEMVLGFAQGYKDVIIADYARERDSLTKPATLTLDITISALWSSLNYWGRKDRPLAVTCDNSQPIQEQFHEFTGTEQDPGILRAREMGIMDPLGWIQSRPLVLEDSRNRPGLQIADLIAGIAAVGVNRRLPTSQANAFFDMIERHTHPTDNLLPDRKVVDLKNKEAAVNWLILMSLGDRAQRQEDPHHLLAELYHTAEATWNNGEFAAALSRAHTQTSS